jgi:mRNA-degrading endonuclease RelE of RelBE toxin-antitoxin system
MLRRIGKKHGRSTYDHLKDLIRELEFEPEKKGQALGGPLKGLYSLHYARFRVIYRVEHPRSLVIVVATGYHASSTRRDIYEVLTRLVEKGDRDLGDGA